MTRDDCDKALQATIRELLRKGASKEDVTQATCGLYIDLKCDEWRSNPAFPDKDGK